MTCDKISQPNKVLLFLGNDIATHLAVNKLVPFLTDTGFSPILIYPQHTEKHFNNQVDLLENDYFESKLLNQTIYPFLEHNGYFRPPNLTPNELASFYDIEVHSAPDINAPDFVKKIRELNELHSAFSINCPQIFAPETIRALNRADGRFSPSTLFNAHAGILPRYQGTFSTAHTLRDVAVKQGAQRPTYGCSLHIIDEGITTGDIICIKSRQILPARTIYATNIELATLTFQAIKEVFTEQAHGNSLTPIPQHTITVTPHFHTSPNKQEIAVQKSFGIEFCEQEEAIKSMVGFFSKPGTPHAHKLEDAIRKAVSRASSKNFGATQHSKTAHKKRQKTLAIRQA